MCGGGRLDPSLFATRSALGDQTGAYDTFTEAGNAGALKVVLSGCSRFPFVWTVARSPYARGSVHLRRGRG